MLFLDNFIRKGTDLLSLRNNKVSQIQKDDDEEVDSKM
jgi:hypothetical protein